MSLLTVAEARAVITTSLDDDALEDVIDREESWLAVKVGPLSGERIETFVTEDGDEVLRLTRHTSSVTVSDDNGAYSGASLRKWADVVPATATAWNGDVEVTYTPDDELSVKRSVITLVRLALGESAYQSESAGGYASTVDRWAQRDMRWAAWSTLLRPPIPSSSRLKSSVAPGGYSIGPVETEAAGS